MEIWIAFYIKCLKKIPSKLLNSTVESRYATHVSFSLLRDCIANYGRIQEETVVF